MTGIDRAIVASNIPEESSFFLDITEAIYKIKIEHDVILSKSISLSVSYFII